MLRGISCRKTTGNTNYLYVIVTCNCVQWGSVMRRVILHVSITLSSYSSLRNTFLNMAFAEIWFRFFGEGLTMFLNSNTISDILILILIFIYKYYHHIRSILSHYPSNSNVLSSRITLHWMPVICLTSISIFVASTGKFLPVTMLIML